MKFVIEDVEVIFPYDYVYQEQIQYMTCIKKALDKTYNSNGQRSTGHCLLEMPTGTGKTACLLAIVLAYKKKFAKIGKLIYCTRTVPEMNKCMAELDRLVKARKEDSLATNGTEEKILGLCLSSRKNMCVHKALEEAGDVESVDSFCRTMTASWVREKGSSANLCSFYENLDSLGNDIEIPSGIYSLEALKAVGKHRGWCPYFLTRRSLNVADVVVFNYQYMLDPKVSNMVSREFENECVVVFDEAHNIDNVCIEALSVTLDERMLENSLRNLKKLQSLVGQLELSNKSRLEKEYEDLRRGLLSQGLIKEHSNSSSHADIASGNPLLPADILDEAMPGSIRKARHFLNFLHKVVMFTKNYFHELNRRQIDINSSSTVSGGSTAYNSSSSSSSFSFTNGTNTTGVSSSNSSMVVDQKTPLSFLFKMLMDTGLERKPLQFTYSRLSSLMRTLEISGLEEFQPISELANFTTLVSSYVEGFAVIFDPKGSTLRGVSEPLLHLACLDASLAIRPVFDRFSNVIITSGTLSPMNLFPKILNFSPAISASLSMSTFRNSLLPLIVTRGNDQLPLSSKFHTREDKTIMKNYGQLVLDVVANVPDGVCCFFPSYQYMEETIQQWEELGIISRLLSHKLLFLETKDVVETTLALDNFKRCCDCGKGALFLSISRGKVAEGVDFDRHYGRCVIILGVPFQYTRSHTLLARLAYMREKYQIKGEKYVTFDALRQTSQCLGRVLRSKTDYGSVILADSRFRRMICDGQQRGAKSLMNSESQPPGNFNSISDIFHGSFGRMDAMTTSLSSTIPVSHRTTSLENPFPAWVLDFLPESSQNLSADVAVEMIKTHLREMGQPISKQALNRILLTEQQVIAKLSPGLVVQKEGNSESSSNININNNNSTTTTTTSNVESTIDVSSCHPSYDLWENEGPVLKRSRMSMDSPDHSTMHESAASSMECEDDPSSNSSVSSFLA